MNGGFARLMAALLIALALSGCIEGDDAHTDSSCPEEHGEPMADEATDEAPAEESSETSGNTSTPLRLQEQPEENETAAENESTEDAEAMDSSHADQADPSDACPTAVAEESAPVDDVSSDEIQRTVMLNADITEGGAPMTVSFTGTINADAVTADGEAYPVEPGDYTWTIQFSEEGPEATGDHTAAIEGSHTYEFVGTFVATLTVTFADGEEVQDTEDIVVAAGEPAGKPSGAFVKDEVYSQDGVLPAGVQGLSCGTGNQAANGVTEAWHTWTFTAAEEDGTETVVTKVDITVTYDPPGLDLDMDFLDPQGNIIDGSHSFNVLSQTWSESISVEGRFAPGDYQVYVVSCGGPILYEIAGTATYVVA